jgi:glycine/D-amino acid oxidase-like deaminating enzyme
MPERVPPPTNWGATPWAIDADIPQQPLPERCDVAVLGAGFAGLSTAYHLARRGARVVVLEADGVGAGASGRTGGMVLEGTAAGPLAQVENCLDTLAAVTAEAGIDCDLTLPGCWTVRHEPAARGRLPGWRDGDGWVVRDDSEPGGTIDPGKLVAGLARSARAGGAVVHEHTPVLEVAAVDGAVRIATGRGELRAGRAAMALNAYTTNLLSLRPSFRTALTLALCTEPLSAATFEAIGMGDDRPFYTHDLPYLWGRRTVDGRLIIGAGLVFPVTSDVRSVQLTLPDAADSMRRLEARTRGLHPSLAGVRITHRWGGPIAFVHGGVPILCEVPTLPGVITYAGCAGHGIALGVRVGQIVASAIVDDTALPEWGAVSEAT